MPTPVVIVPQDFQHVHSFELGVFANARAKLVAKGYPVPRIAVIPATTLKQIAEANSIVTKLKPLLRQTNFADPVANTKLAKTIEQCITKQTLPKPLLQEFARIYHQYFEQKAVKVFPGNTPDGDKHATHAAHGDANLIVHFLKSWSNTAQLLARHTHAREVHTLLYSYPLLIQEEPPILTKGTAISKHPLTGSKTSIYITTDRQESYEVDIRTWNIIARKGSSSSHSPKQILADAQIQTLARMVNSIKKQYLEHKEISWYLANGTIGITAVRDYDEQWHTITPQVNTTITKLYLFANHTDAIRSFAELPFDGGILKGEQAILKFGFHPQALLKGEHRAVLKNQLLAMLEQYVRAFPHKSWWYRPLTSSSDELKKLQYAATYEPDETNPFLGMRGALKQLLEPELFELELEVLDQCIQTTKKRIGIVLPFVRTATELSRLLDRIAAHNVNSTNSNIWWQIDTPENMLNITSYPLKRITGIQINIESVMALIYGIDPNARDIYERYTFDLTLFETLLKQVLSHLAGLKLPVCLQFEHYRPQLVENAIALGIDAIVVQPSVAPVAKACIMETEARPLLEKTTGISNTLII